MKSSARRHEPPGALAGLLSEAASAAGYAISRNPVLVGGTTAFMVTLFYVSANALWYQPFFHSGAFVATRSVISSAPVQTRPEPVAARPVTSIPVPTPEPAPPAASDTMRTDAIAAPAGDEKVARIQSVLRELNLYDGDVDGLTGPKTRAAIQSYQRIVGLEPTGEASERIMQMLASRSSDHQPAVPSPTPRATETVAAAAAADPKIARVQAGLRAFGNEGIDIDGRMGGRTRSALKEFQSLFGLPVTGEADADVMAKMQEIGLVE
jgi:peptidoglycan hydrolase-like protein with peptidoglycan-binding domain